MMVSHCVVSLVLGLLSALELTILVKDKIVSIRYDVMREKKKAGKGKCTRLPNLKRNVWLRADARSARQRLPVGVKSINDHSPE